MGWRWFYVCWVLSLGGISLSFLVIYHFKEVHLVEALWTIISRAFVFYEMWLWSFHSKRIVRNGNSYRGKRSVMPERVSRKSSINPRIFEERKLPFVPHQSHWDDNSYSVAEQFIIANSKPKAPQRPRKTYTKSELNKRMTGLTTEELEVELDDVNNYPSRFWNLLVFYILNPQ